MAYYLTLFLFLFSLQYALRGRAKARKQIYPFVLCALFLFSAFRFEVGCDWSGYYFQWRGQLYSTFEAALSTREPTWWTMMDGLQSLGLIYPWLHVASSAIFFTGAHVLAKRQPDPLGFLIFLFPILIVNMPMSGARQAAAIGIMCIAFAAFMDRKLFPFAIWTLLAATFHNSAIIFLLLLPLVGGNLTAARISAAIVLALPGSYFLLTGEAADIATERYIETERQAFGGIFRAGVLIVSGLGFIYFIKQKWRYSFPKDYTLVRIGALMMCMLAGLFPMSSIIADRYGYYLIPIQAMIFARIPYLHFTESRSFYVVAPYALIGLTFFVWIATSWHFEKCYIPYQTWLFGLPESIKFKY